MEGSLHRFTIIMRQLHQIQLSILKKLLFAQTLRNKDLQPEENIPSNKLSFHIEQLIESNLIQKTEGEYSLTAEGKEYANRMNTETKKITRQAKNGVMLICTREKNGETEILIYTRKKQPFYNKQGFPTGKIHRGERAHDTAQRELKEETNLE